MNNKITWPILGIIMFILGYLYASPYIVLNSMKNAAQAGDSVKVSQYIDYPSVRQSLKEQTNAVMLKEIDKHEQNPLNGLGAMLASTLLDKTIDVLVTPEGMTLMLQGKDLKEVYQTKVPQQSTDVKQQHKPSYKAGYTAWDEFEVVIQAPENSKVVKVIMMRDGLSWKVNRIVIPLQ